MSSRRKGWLQLAITTGLVLIVWGSVLPWLSRRPFLRHRIDFLDERGIDPAALYYTDLEVMEQIEAKMTKLRRQHSHSFWRYDQTRD